MGTKHEIEHDLAPGVARQAIDSAMRSYLDRFRKYDPHFEWAGERDGEFGFKAKGLKVKGEFELQDDSLLIDVQVPLVLRAFKGKAIEVIDREVRRWIERAQADAL